MDESGRVDWKTWVSEFCNFKVTIKWFKMRNDNLSRIIKLHGFADVSKVAYAAVVYMRLISSIDGSVSVFLLASKCRVSPLSKSLSIPQLELMATLLLVRLVNFLTPLFPLLRMCNNMQIRDDSSSH